MRQHPLALKRISQPFLTQSSLGVLVKAAVEQHGVVGVIP
jgi:hypothetical protein